MQSHNLRQILPAIRRAMDKVVRDKRTAIPAMIVTVSCAALAVLARRCRQSAKKSLTTPLIDADSVSKAIEPSLEAPADETMLDCSTAAADLAIAAGEAARAGKSARALELFAKAIGAIGCALQR